MRSLLLLGLCLTSLSASAGERIRFDADWRFRRDPLPARHADGGFSWKYRDAEGATFKNLKLPDGGEWKPTRIGEDLFHGRAGFLWYQAEIGAGKANPNRVLHFDGVDDNAAVFVNGVLLARHAGWNDAFDVRLAKVWKPEGPNIATILVENNDGPGGIGGAVTIDFVPPDSGLEPVNPGFNDRRWRAVHLPHDYVVEGTFERNADNSHGSLPVAPAWYRKTFTLPASYKGKSLWLDFDGIYRKATVYLNGRKLGEWPSGYIGTRYDITPYAKLGGKNVLAVHVDPRQVEGWWYEGGGIYRHVWLNVANSLHVAPDGAYVRSTVRGKGADVRLETAVANDSSVAATCRVVSKLVSPEGSVVATRQSQLTVPARGTATAVQSASVGNARLWSLERPSLYKVVTSVVQSGETLDSREASFGIRTIRFDKDKGFFLNGKPVKLKGTCNHQDHAGVGIAVPDGLLEWRIRKLKEMGSNAYRCAHNPPATELLDACDRLGMLVMEETRHLGDTTQAKTSRGTPATELSELRRMVLRDRNHPSIVMWSLANEEPLQGTDEGARLFTAMRNLVRKLDPTRPCTAAMNGGWGDGISRVEDLVGLNYSIGEYDPTRKKLPNVPLYASETASTYSTRGIYRNDERAGHVSAYDVNAPGHGATAEAAWRPIAERPWMAGGFVWTGFDYKGEPSPYGWPSIGSQCGILDSCGFPKDNFYYYQAWWSDKPVVHILPHWNWAGQEGKAIDVWVQSNADRVELFLNGKSLGSQKMPRYGHLEWKVPYRPGKLEAKGYRNGKLIAADQVSTAGAPYALRLTTDRTKVLADNEDVTVVAVEIVDAMGRVVPTASNLVRFATSGGGRIGGVGNGDPSSHEPDKASERRAFKGRCMALVGVADSPGVIVLRATAPGLKAATIRLTAEGRFVDR